MPKLELSGTCDPSAAPAARALPRLPQRCLHLPGGESITAARMKVYKNADSYKYFRSGWVNIGATGKQRTDVCYSKKQM